MPDSLTDENTVPRAVERAEAAVLATVGPEALQEVRDGEACWIADTIADLLHLGEEHDHLAEDVIDSARLHFYAERDHA